MPEETVSGLPPAVPSGKKCYWVETPELGLSVLFCGAEEPTQDLAYAR